MDVLLDAIGLLSLTTAGIGIVYLLFSAVTVRRFRGYGIAPAPFPPRAHLPDMTKVPPLRFASQTTSPPHAWGRGRVPGIAASASSPPSSGGEVVCEANRSGGRIPDANALPKGREDLARSVSILVPLCGAEPGLKRRLECLCDQNCRLPPQIICGVADAGDEAAELVRTLMRERPDANIQLCIDPRTHGRNAKVSNLINMAQRADHEVFFLIDSDIEVPPDFVGKLAGLLQRPGVGAATCLYYGAPLCCGSQRSGLWARLSAAGITSHFLPNAVTGLSLKLARPCFGATIALTRGMLWRIGGLTAFADHLWDDYAIGEAVRRTGSEVVMASFALPHFCAERSASELFSRELRSARTIRCIAPLGYLGNLFTHPLGFALIALAAGWTASAIAAAILAIAARAWLCRSVSRRFDAVPVPPWLQPLRDILAFAVYIGGGFGRKIVWRGKEYRVAPDGALTPVRSSNEELSEGAGGRFSAS